MASFVFSSDSIPNNTTPYLRTPSRRALVPTPSSNNRRHHHARYLPHLSMAGLDIKSPGLDKPHDYDEKRSDSSLDLDSVDELHMAEKNGLLATDDRNYDVEAVKLLREKTVAPSATTGAEYNISTRTKLVYLAGYFALNLLLTIYNKAVLGGFAFPWLLTTLHCSFVTVGCYGLLAAGRFHLTPLTMHQNLILIAFSFLFTINIAISTVSLQAVSVPFHQIARSTCPIFTIAIYRIFYARTYATATYLSLIPVILGVGLATYGDYYFSLSGFTLTMLGVVLASVKTVVSNRLMTGNLKLPALEILLRMSPLAAIQSIVYAHLAGETRGLHAAIAAGQISNGMWLALLGNGFIAFVLNISSFQTNKLAGALTITVAANLKQTLTILLGIVLFNVRVGFLNGLGMMITLVGAAWYSKVELDSKGRK